MPIQTSRRAFLHSSLAGVAAAACSRSQAPTSGAPSAAANGGGVPSAGSKPPEGPRPGAPNEGDVALPKDGVMPKRTLGKTGEKVSMFGLGGFHIGIPKDEREGVRLIRRALDGGLNFLDNCWDYHDGDSELRMGKALKDGYRDKAFVMTKIDGRTRQAAAGQIDQSLQRLGVDWIDLLQLHEVIRLDDAERVFAEGGAIEAIVAARKAGKIRYVGFTGHKSPDIHLHMLETADQHGFRFDAVQMPLNPMDPHHASFEKKVLPVLLQKGIGVLGMKPLGSGIILESGVVTAPECLRYAASLPTSVVITGCETMGVLEQALAIGYGFQPMGADERAALLARTAKVAGAGKYERFKISEQFDGTTKNPKWLEKAEI